MEDYLKELSEEGNSVASALIAGHEIASLQEIPLNTAEEETRILVKDGFHIERIDNNNPNPKRHKGKTILNSAKSFCWYVNKYKQTDSLVIIANEEIGEIKAILNAHNRAMPGWQDFNALLRIGFSTNFETWVNSATTDSLKPVFLTQEEFANFIEDNAADIETKKRNPLNEEAEEDPDRLTAIKIRELVSNLKLTTKEELNCAIDITNGDIKVNYNSETEGKDSFAMPSDFYLNIPIYKNEDVFRVKIKLRTRKNGAMVAFYYIIHQLEALKTAAFDKVCERIENGVPEGNEEGLTPFEGVNLEVLRGTF